MQIAFSYPCHVGVVTLDGDMTSMTFGAGEAVSVVNAGCLTMENRSHQDFETSDGLLLLHVPLAAICWESEYVGCV